MLAKPSQQSQKKNYSATRTDEETALSLVKYVVLDFKHVLGVDATAIRSCFLNLKQTCLHCNVTLLFCNVNVTIQQILRTNGDPPFLPSYLFLRFPSLPSHPPAQITLRVRVLKTRRTLCHGGIGTDMSEALTRP